MFYWCSLLIDVTGKGMMFVLLVRSLIVVAGKGMMFVLLVFINYCCYR